MRDPEDRRPFAQAMQLLCAAYRVEATKPLLLAYFIAMRSLRLEEVQAAVARALELANEHMPTAGELRRIARPAALPYHQPWEPPKFERREPWPALPAKEGS